MTSLRVEHGTALAKARQAACSSRRPFSLSIQVASTNP